jgi:acid phosphatase
MVCEQAYRLARMCLDEALDNPDFTAAEEQVPPYSDLPPAVILDLDETVLDNSLFEGAMIREDRSFDPESWNEWASQGRAGAVPGALAFTRHAVARGVAVFYVTNRDHAVEEATRRNLAELGFPVAEGRDSVLTRGERPEWDSDKSSRRKLVAKTHRILLLVGDDAHDFFPLGKDSPVERARRAGERRALWGRGYIVLPNPQYGGWEGSLYGFEYGLEERARNLRKAAGVAAFR